MQYQLIRSTRRTMAVEIRNGMLLVRAPYSATRADVEQMLRDKRGWIEKHLRLSQERAFAAQSVSPLTSAELKSLVQSAKIYIPQRVRYFAQLIGVQPGKITIRSQRTRWGSCSAKGNLNFNCILMLTPQEVIDSVIVHELCHLKEMNHSDRFYREVLRVFPDYRTWHGWLKDHQAELLARLG